MTARPFTDFLREQRRGGLLDELTSKLHDLIGAVETVGKSGKLVLTLEVKQHKNDTGGVVIVVDDVEVKPPKPERDGSIWFVTPEGNLSKSDPVQATLNIGPVAVKKEIA